MPDATRSSTPAQNCTKRRVSRSLRSKTWQKRRLLLRTSIYNYFQTKEEIFLALLEREYALWNADLAAILNENDALTVEEFSDKLARSLEKRQRLLKLLSMNHYDLESSSRIENLTEFKRAYGKALRLVACLLENFSPAMTAHEVRNFVYIFFPYLFGIYPYTYVTEKQRTAMKNAGVDYATLCGL